MASRRQAASGGGQLKLHVHEWGASGAPPLVCLHGVQAHGRRFRRLAEERLAERFRVLAPDLRGHGRSGWDEPWNLETHVADVVETLPSTRTWIGHSFGGRLVMEIAARASPRVERAVLLDPAMLVPPDIAHWMAADERVDKSFASVDEAIAKRIASGGLLHTPREYLEEEMQEHLERSSDGRYRYRYSQEAVVAAYEEMTSPPPPFERLAVPTLLVVAAASKLVSAGELELYRQALGDLLDVVVVPGGHLLLWDAYEETAAAVSRFLD